MNAPTPPAELIAVDPSLINYIPNEKFRGRLRATVASSARGLSNYPTTSFISATTEATDTGDIVHLWTWSAAADITSQRLAIMARQHVNAGRRGAKNRRHIERVAPREHFASVDGVAGYASHVAYRVVES